MKPQEPDDGRSLPERIRQLEPDTADSQFQESLRRSFAKGRGREQSVRRWWRRAVLAPAAAVVVVGIILWFLNDAPPYRIVHRDGTASFVVGGQTVSSSDLEEALRDGTTLAVPEEASLTLLVSGVAYWELVGGSRLDLISGVGDLEAHLQSGELRIATTDSFEGRRLTVSTPHGVVAVRGSSLSVQCDASGTCVCVIEGEVAVGIDAGDLERIPPGQRKVMLASGQTQVLPVAPAHQSGVREFEARVRR